ncbi:MAG: hypothetical protein HY518_04415 [Candidatus Aenigmarchaeota archaeon]|nr:hypothetical protein [Candidatus Aenigmarchaeota archaeon]
MMLKMFAVVVSSMLLLAQASYATDINIVLGGGSSRSAVRFNPESLVSKQVSVNPSQLGASIKVRVAITGALDDVPLEKVFIYKCRDTLPLQCAVNQKPDVFAGSVNTEYEWSDVASSAFPQTANLFYLVKMRSEAGQEIWFGLWDQIKRISSATFTQPPYGRSLSELNVEPVAASTVDELEEFLSASKVLPSTSSWLRQFIFLGAAKLHILKAGKAGISTPAFQTEQVAGNQLSTPIGNDVYLVFPEVNSEVNNPVTIVANNPVSTCGNRKAETGEDSANCCYDVGCAQAALQYCDTAVNRCQQTNAIALTLDSAQSKVSNCNRLNRINATVRINSPPGGLGIASTSVTLGGISAFHSCVGGPETGYRYTCTIDVPPIPGCTADTYRLGPNILQLSISFNSGPGTLSKTLSAQLPDITVGSYVFGDGVCESSLGENTDTRACYDCGCPAGLYCELGAASAGACRQRPSSSNLIIYGVEPANFRLYDQSAGNDVRFSFDITNVPATFLAGVPNCSTACAASEGACEVDCGLSCEPQTGPQNTFKAACVMNLRLAGYDNSISYRFTPGLSMPVSYMDGINPVSAELSEQVGIITLGTNFCGDDDITPGEEATCCYDAGCPPENYCDLAVEGDPASGECRNENSIGFSAVPSTASFVDSAVPHTFDVAVSITNMPTGASVDYGCAIGGEECGRAEFAVNCEETGNGAYRAACHVEVPAMNYKKSRFFDAASNLVRIGQNKLTYTVRFKDGQVSKSKSFSAQLPDITITPVARCGNGVAETEFGETAENCCLDIECQEDSFCYTGQDPNGACTPTSALRLVIDGISPDPVKCEIVQLNEECVYTAAVKVNAHVTNSPSNLLIDYTGAYFTLNNQSYPIDYCSRNTSGNSTYTCHIILPNEEVQASLEDGRGTISKDISINLPVSFGVGKDTFVQELAASAVLNIVKLKSDYLRSLEKDIRKLDDKIDRLNRIIKIIAITLVIWAVVCVACHWYCQSAVQPCWQYWGCATGVSLVVVGTVLTQMGELKAGKEQLEAQRTGKDASNFGANRRGSYLTLAGTIASSFLCKQNKQNFAGGNPGNADASGGFSTFSDTPSVGTSPPRL